MSQRNEKKNTLSAFSHRIRYFRKCELRITWVLYSVLNQPIHIGSLSIATIAHCRFLSLSLTQIPNFASAYRRIRGTLCSLVVLGSSFGMLLGFAAGHYLDYNDTPRIALVIPILFLALFSLMPETPHFLARTNRLEVCLQFGTIVSCEYQN